MKVEQSHSKRGGPEFHLDLNHEKPCSLIKLDWGVFETTGTRVPSEKGKTEDDDTSGAKMFFS